MEIELLEIRDFLAAHGPFNALPPQDLDRLPRLLTIRYLRRGSPFPPPDADTDTVYILRSGSIEFRDGHGLLYDKLDEGDFHGCGVTTPPEGWRAVASEDSLLYLLPCSELDTLRGDNKDFDHHFSAGLAERLAHGSRLLARSRSEGLSNLGERIADSLARSPVSIEADASIREAARAMTDNTVSSIMITEQGRLVGLITDSTLRKRCIVDNISPDAPVRDIMKTRVATISADASLFEALTTMSRLQVYHLPVLRGEELIGIITSSDLSRSQSTNAAFIASDIRKATTIEQLAAACAHVPELQLQLARASATAAHIGDAVSVITDTVTVRLIELAQTKLGPAPVPWVWVAGGSQARREQTAHSDQDNAIIISDALQPEHADWFDQLSRFVCDGLNSCGYPWCPGEAMAMNPQWRQPLQRWRQYFAQWIERPEPKALMLACIFFDLRAVYGDTQLLQELKREILGKTRNNGLFTAYMASNALTHRPPIGLFRQFVLIHDGEHDETLDIKHRGIIPITDLARVFAYNEGIDAVGTLDRLRAAAGTPSVSREMSESLCAAFEFIAGLRIAHQARQIHAGDAPDNYLPPTEISGLERQQLKDAFSVIKDMQDTLDNRYQLARFR